MPRSAITYLLPDSSARSKTFGSVLLRLGLVDFDDTSIELCLVHVVDRVPRIFCERELDIAKAPVRVSV